jgi:predicted dehydrogenase
VGPFEQPVRLGIIGCGNVLDAYGAAIDQLRLNGDAEVRLVCGRAAQADRARAVLRTGRFVTEAREVIGSPEVDVVVILTQADGHCPLARQALEAGKHVLVEKPLATSLEDANELVELAARSPGHLVCAPFTTLSPTFRAIAGHIRRGDIGRPCSARARYGWSGPSWNPWFYRSGGGCLFDLGVYCLTTLTALLGPARQVMAMTGIAIPTREIRGERIRVEVEDNAQVLIDFGNQTFGAVTTGFTIQQYRSPALEIFGTLGSIQMLGDDWDPDGYELWQNAAGAWQVFRETRPDWPWTDGLRHLVVSLREDRLPMPTAEHGRHVLEIMLAAQQSGRQGRAIPIESTFPEVVVGGLDVREPAHLVHDRSRH